jgi:hypothetical protein
MSGQSKTKRSKRKTRLKADVVIRLFLHDTLAIRNLKQRIQELDQKLGQEFVSFNRISESLENRNDQILDLLLEPILRSKRLEKARSQQQRVIALSFETEEKINRLLEARSDAICVVPSAALLHRARVRNGREESESHCGGKDDSGHLYQHWILTLPEPLLNYETEGC